MEEGIDLAAVVESLQHDNEQLRFTIYRLRAMQTPLDMIDTNKIKAWLIRNYTLIAIVVPLAFLLLSFVDTVGRFFPPRKGDS